MSACYDLHLARPGLEGVRFLICRDALSSNGDLETGFFDAMEDLHRPSHGLSLSAALCQAARRPGTRAVVCIRNPHLVLDKDLPGRVAEALASLPSPEGWAIAGAGGLGRMDHRYLALYASRAPALPLAGAMQPVLDLMPDLTIINAAFAAALPALDAPGLDPALETILAVEGYIAGRVSLMLPMLTAGIEGDLMGRDIDLLTRALHRRFGIRLAGQTLLTLTGEVALPTAPDTMEASPDLRSATLQQCFADAIALHADPVSLSVITRTRFDRPHLLRRLLTSLSRARDHDIALEIVLASDAELALCEAELSALSDEFPALDLRLCHGPSEGPSRMANLVRGISAARHDYVTVIDDDDYLDLLGLSALKTAFFMGRRPLIFVRCDAHAETWEHPPGGRPIVTQSTLAESYPPHRWREMFAGVNKLPICSLIAPTHFVQARMAAWQARHDLSEDYALFLLLLTAPNLPEIYEIEDVFCHISLRQDGQSMTMGDRRPWVRDITGHLSALLSDPDVAGPGIWQQLAVRQDGGQLVVRDRALQDMQAVLDARAAELRVLRLEAKRLRAELAARTEVTA